ncbi:protein of unknown function DUF397 [Streptomyces xiamenensis]|uniref:DUF397 domain-containing protein n=1 Tax=Streptomyces xiamenensis TaxID=408015 RepID=A0A0F7FWL8_9ACTN|nr:DUF397 domain-containing protein [Streptomyces xiamenensis]AKG44403.1 protein of unknown function DUF397 [Streptomyces xiamenensis]
MTETPKWFTSSYSDNGGVCIEVAVNLVPSCGVVPVRDSKHREGPEVAFPATAWSTFVNSLKH